MISLVCVFCVLSQLGVTAFLLQPDHASRTNASQQKYISLQEFMTEKKEVKHRIDQLELEYKQTLDILTKQLQNKFSILKDKIIQTAKQNETLRKFDMLEMKYRDIEKNYTLLKQAQGVLQQSFKLQESEITTLRNKSVQLEKEISTLVQLKTIYQSFNLNNVQVDVQELKQTTSLLQSNQNTRNQDFLALYNRTRTTDRNLQEQVKHFEILHNSTFQNVFSLIKNNSDVMENGLVRLAHELNTSLSDVFSQMNVLRSQVGDNSKKVALTACTSVRQYVNEAVKFPIIYTSVGITNQSSFLSTGKFVCDVPGLYYISSYIRTNSEAGFWYTLHQNDLSLSQSATSSWPGNPGFFSASVITAVAEVQKNDELYLRVAHSNQEIYGFSCLSVIKVK